MAVNMEAPEAVNALLREVVLDRSLTLTLSPPDERDPLRRQHGHQLLSYETRAQRKGRPGRC
jgi:hypothetical protein